MQSLDYDFIAETVRDLAQEEQDARLASILEPAWIDLYLQMSPGEASIDVWPRGSFHYVFDTPSCVLGDREFDWATDNDDRVVVVYGRSAPVPGARDPYNMRGPLGQREWGTSRNELPFDRGHYIAHQLGGFEDMGLFPQRRDINRGHTERGRVFRSMERYCASHPGTFLFARPIYLDRSGHPFYLEYGVLRQEGGFWVETFENRYTDKPFRDSSDAPEWFRAWAEKERAIMERKEERRQRLLAKGGR